MSTQFRSEQASLTRLNFEGDHMRNYVLLDNACQCQKGENYLVIHGVFPTAVLFGYPNKHQLIAYLKLSVAST
jgi:hypothetical protein